MPWLPRNKFCWDFWFAWQGQQLHVFYLQASTFACAFNPTRRHNLASIGHAIMTEYGWQEVDPQTPVLAPREGKFWDNLSIWTGSIIETEGLYYLVYSARSKDTPLIQTPHERRIPQNIGIAVSSDLRTWARTPATEVAPVIPNPGVDSEFDGSNWRDPYVIKDDIDGQFYAFICAHSQHSEADVGGLIAYATSTDMAEWQQSYKVLYASQEFYLLEVPQVFWRQMSDRSWRLYLLFAPHWSPFFVQPRQVGVTYYVRSQPIADRRQVSYDRIPWEPEPANLLCDGLFAGKLLKPDTELYPGFIGFQKEDEAGNFVGGLSDPLWAVFQDDGKIDLRDSKPAHTPVAVSA